MVSLSFQVMDLSRCILREEHRHTCFHIGRQSQESHHICLDLRRHSVVVAVAEPYAQLVRPADRQNDARDFILQSELLAYESQDEILPDLVGIAFGELQTERGTFLVLGVLPNRLDALDKQIASCAFRHLAGAL